MQKPLSLLLLLTFLNLSLTSCARFQNRPINPAQSALAHEARTLASKDLRDFINTVLVRTSNAVIQHWTLDELSLAAFYYHPDLALARAQEASSVAAITTAGQSPNPSITITPTWIRNLATAAVPWIAASSFSIPIETAGKRDFRIDKATHLKEAASLRIADVAWLVRNRLHLAVIEVFAAQQTARLLQQQLAIQTAINQHLEQQAILGELSQLEVTRGRLAAQQLQLNQDAAQKRYAESRVALATAIGIPVQGLHNIDLDLTTLSEPPDLQAIAVSKLKEQALRHRPDLLAALADYAAAQSALQLEIANQYPNIQANPGYAWEMGEHRWTLGATLLLPILHQNQGAIAEAEAKRDELAVRFEALQLRILGDIERAQAGLQPLLAKWQQAQLQQHLQQKNRHMAEALLKAGEIDQLALLTVELENTLTDKSRLDVLLETQIALAGLEDSLRIPLGGHSH